MADITVTIPSPTLQGSEKFKVRYRTLPSGSFGASADKFTNTFILTGLSVGNYEIEIVFVTEDGTECDPVYYEFEVAAEFTCWDFSATQEETSSGSGLYRIKLNFSGGTQPPCGWEIAVTPSGGTTSIYTYPTLPVSNVVNIAIANNVVHTVTVTALLCNGKEKECYTVATTAVPTPPSCIGATLVDASLLPPPFPNQLWTIYIEFSQSTPPTNDAQIFYQQTGTPRNAGGFLDSGSFIQTGYLWGSTAGGNSTIYIQGVNPQQVWGQYTYNIRFLDRCGNWLTTTVAFG